MSKAKVTDPRMVGGRYLSGYWQQEYTVTAIRQQPGGFTAWTCAWADGRTTEHMTAWDARRDRIVSQP